MEETAESERVGRGGEWVSAAGWWHLQCRPVASIEHGAMVAMGTAVLGEG